MLLCEMNEMRVLDLMLRYELLEIRICISMSSTKNLGNCMSVYEVRNLSPNSKDESFWNVYLTKESNIHFELIKAIEVLNSVKSN